MRRLLHAALILAMVAVIPTSVLAGFCGGSTMSCCRKAASAELSLTRPDCCSAPCIEAAPERHDSASETRPTRLHAPDAAPLDVPSLAPIDRAPARAEAGPASSPPLGRRLASLSTLLI